MKMREEIDAMRTLGLDPIDVLVVPRVLALILTLPLLGFIADMAGLIGGAAMSWISLGVSPGMFMTRLQSMPPTAGTSPIGIIKAPFFALIIGLIGCYEGHDGRGQRRVARPQHLDLGGAGDLPRHRRRRRFLDLLLAGGPLMAEAARGRDRGARARQPVRHQRHPRDLDLDVYRGEVLGVVGGSGTGKSVLLRTIVGLNRPAAGTIKVFGVDVLHAPDAERKTVERRWGVMFQDGALFSALTRQAERRGADARAAAPRARRPARRSRS